MDLNDINHSFKILIPLDDADSSQNNSSSSSNNNNSNPAGLKCEMCLKMFIHEVDLKTHMKIHNGEKPFQCNFPGCYRKFNRRTNLEYHEKLYHNYKKKGKETIIKKCKDFIEKIKKNRKKEENNKNNSMNVDFNLNDYKFTIDSISPLKCKITKKKNDKDYCLCGILTKGLPFTKSSNN